MFRLEQTFSLKFLCSATSILGIKCIKVTNMKISECSLFILKANRHVILWTRMLVLKLIFRLTSSFAFPWKIVCALWTSWAKVEDSCVIFCRPSYVISLWSGSISPSKMSKSTNVLSNSFSKRSNQRNMDTATAIFETACDVSTRETIALWDSLRSVRIKIWTGLLTRGLKSCDQN